MDYDQRMEHLLGIMYVRRKRRLNHSKFSYDTLFIGVTSVIIAKRLNQVLDHTIFAYRMKMNSSKSQIYS